MNKSESIKELATALAKFQGEVANPTNSKTVSVKTSKGTFSYKYAPLDEVLSIVRPILSKNGLSVVQAPIMDDGMVGVSTTLLHESGEWIEFEPILLKMDKVTAQGAGSSITYARRYSLSAILGISSEDDDDGNIAEEQAKPKGDKSNLSENQIKRLYAIGKSRGVDRTSIDKSIVTQYKKNNASELTKEEYDDLCGRLEALPKSE